MDDERKRREERDGGGVEPREMSRVTLRVPTIPSSLTLSLSYDKLKPLVPRVALVSECHRAFY